MSRRSVLVIGMGPGLGRALVRTFARKGNRVAFVGRRKAEIERHERELRAEGLEVTGIVGDAGEPQSMNAVHAKVRELYGSPEVLIYNAAKIEPARFVTQSAKPEVQYGGAAGWASLGEPADVDDLISAFKTNVAGAHHAALAVVPAMIVAGSGTVLLTGGVLAFGPWIEWGVTSLTKAALRSFGLSLEKELSGHGIHVCTVAIHGTMESGTAYDHGLVADAYWRLCEQSPAEWQPEFHFRHNDEARGDPDA